MDSSSISSVNPKYRALSDIVFIYFVQAPFAFGTSAFWLLCVWLAGAIKAHKVYRFQVINIHICARLAQWICYRVVALTAKVSLLLV